MSERDQLEHDLGESLWALDPPPEECGPDSRGWADAEDRNRERVAAVLAVLDQQGWPQDCPTVEATDRGAPASPLSTSQVETILRQHESPSVPTPTRFLVLNLALRCLTALREVERLEAALREAARYEQGPPVYYWRPGALMGHTVKSHDESCIAGNDCVAIFASGKVTEAGEG